MKISIVVPVYNVEKYLRRCLDSIISDNKADNNIEIIIVNDGSKDSSQEIAEQYSLKYNNIIIVSQSNQGLSMARNNGLKRATGDYVWFVDSDDWISDGAIDVIRTSLEKNLPDVLQIRAANLINGTDFVRGKEFTCPGQERDGATVFVEGNWETCAPFYVFRRKFLIDNNLTFFPGVFHEDNEFTPRMLLSAKSLIQINQVLYHVFQNPNSITRSVNYKKAFDLLIIVEELSKFMHRRQLSDDVAKKLSSFISLTLNSSFFATRGMSRDLKKQYKAKLTLNKRYWHCLERSGIRKYRLEYYLFKIFPNYLGVYRCLKHFSSRHFL